MNRIKQKFQQLRQINQTAFIGYVMAGDPTMQHTVDAVLAMEQGGADIVEIGIPFSDPLADGPVIQAAALRSFASGTKVMDVFHCVKAIRTQSEIPLLLMVYFNTVYQRGIQAFVDACTDAGVDGLIVPDVPLEEREELLQYTDPADLCLIPLIAPTSGARVADIAKGSSGFLYCVSSMGVTGMRSQYADDVVTYLQSVRQQTDLPIAVGFGIRDREAVEFFSPHADGVIVGSVIVDTMGRTNGDAAAVEQCVRQMTQSRS